MAVFPPPDVQQRCVAAFKQGDHDEAERLIPEIQQPQNVVTEFIITGDLRETVTVVLLHLAAYHGWLDIIKYPAAGTTVRSD